MKAAEKGDIATIQPIFAAGGDISLGDQRDETVTQSTVAAFSSLFPNRSTADYWSANFCISVCGLDGNS